MEGLDDSILEMENKTNEFLSLQERFEKYKVTYKFHFLLPLTIGYSFLTLLLDQFFSPITSPYGRYRDQ